MLSAPSNVIRLMIWFGFGLWPKVAIAALITFFPMLVNALAAHGFDVIAGSYALAGHRLDGLRDLVICLLDRAPPLKRQLVRAASGQ